MPPPQVASNGIGVVGLDSQETYLTLFRQLDRRLIGFGVRLLLGCEAESDGVTSGITETTDFLANPSLRKGKISSMNPPFSARCRDIGWSRVLSQRKCRTHAVSKGASQGTQVKHCIATNSQSVIPFFPLLEAVNGIVGRIIDLLQRKVHGIGNRFVHEEMCPTIALGRDRY